MKIAKILATAAATAALLVPLTTANAAPTPGDGAAGPDIAGGTTTSISAAPYAAQISFDSTGTSVGCTGSQISPDWVITAKHCNKSTLNSVRLGTTYLETGGTVKTVAARYAAPSGDMLLLKLSTPHYGSYASLGKYFPATGSAAKVYGWGDQTEGAGTMSYNFKTANVTVSGQGVDGTGGVSVRTQSQSGHTLGGDSGGPLVVNGKLVGVLSTSNILPPQNPSDFTSYYNNHASISSNLRWITSVSGVTGS